VNAQQRLDAVRRRDHEQTDAQQPADAEDAPCGGRREILVKPQNALR
jgi:hypothetical protein